MHRIPTLTLGVAAVPIELVGVDAIGVSRVVLREVGVVGTGDRGAVFGVAAGVPTMVSTFHLA